MGWLVVLFCVMSCSWRSDSMLSPILGLVDFVSCHRPVPLQQELCVSQVCWAKQ